MIKKFLVSILVIAGFLSCQVQAADACKEGVNYKGIAQTATPHKEIREFFSFWCGHCYSLQPMFNQIEKRFENEATFERNPINLMGGNMGVESQKALAVAQLLKIDDLYVETLFKQMHVDGNIPSSHDDFVRLFESLGVPAQTFESDYNSFPVLGKVSTWDKLTDDYKLDAVPEVVINGKYLTIMESVDTQGEFIDLIAYLLTLN